MSPPDSRVDPNDPNRPGYDADESSDYVGSPPTTPKEKLKSLVCKSIRKGLLTDIAKELLKRSAANPGNALQSVADESESTVVALVDDKRY